MLVSASRRNELRLRIHRSPKLKAERKVRDREDALANTFATANPTSGGRDACATRRWRLEPDVKFLAAL
ncbi:MAG: hypothetical protein DME98_14375 [Verrucomicrobia bacterium]|nr:MAG: hypothetical protein DME98_14375 [Verrucomicrobiota bacterium]PYJ33428.1 MAG: hypothetical protein DME88_08405 [Verrucomicrobiota bacterium]